MCLYDKYVIKTALNLVEVKLIAAHKLPAGCLQKIMTHTKQKHLRD